ncbi:S-layer homology domain-containing protein, partial [Patescibacteria group bacterium]|nr:S-layer homology domain-containing protein [Patescibacteria group bacterium]
MKIKNNYKLKFSITVILSVFVFALFANFASAQTTTSTASGIQAVATGFSDVSRAHSYYVSITYLNEVGVLGGYSDGTFKPENTINRAEVLKVILSGAGIQPAETFEQLFPDVNADHWFAPYVLKAKEL